MAAPAYNTSNSGGLMTMEQQLLNFYVESLRDFSKIWLNEKDMDSDTMIRYRMQFAFLVESIPSKEIRKKIWDKQRSEEKALKESGEQQAYEISCMCAVSAIMEFLASTFDLLHEDIVGAATSRQYRDSVLEIPDMPSPSVKDPVIISGESNAE